MPERSGTTRVVSPRFVDYAHRAGLGVQVWTVDEEADARRLLDWGVDALITDRPDRIVPVVRGTSASSNQQPATVRRLMNPPTLHDIYAARERVQPVIRPTPLMRHPLLAAETGLDILVKHENHNPTGAFKVRGGLNLIGSLSADERRGVITATTGNHGQSIALACQRERRAVHDRRADRQQPREERGDARATAPS